MSSYRQYLRKFQLIAQDEDGQGVDLSEFRVVFTVNKRFTSTPNDAIVTIYNLSEQTKQRFLKNEFTKLFLQAGYEGNFSLIITGDIKDKRAGIENGVNTFIEVAIADGDKALNNSITSVTLAAGSTPKDHIDIYAKDFANYDITEGTINTGATDAYSLPRAKTIFGQTSFHARNTGRSIGSDFSIIDNKIQYVLSDSTIDEEAVSINTSTGMIGSPQQTIEGINAKCLLNPRIKVNGQVFINQEDVILAPVDGLLLNAKPSVSVDGHYKIQWLTHSGDTRGNEWSTSFNCLSMDKSADIATGGKVVGGT